jgi:hypothetical protein
LSCVRELYQESRLPSVDALYYVITSQVSKKTGGGYSNPYSAMGKIHEEFMLVGPMLQTQDLMNAVKRHNPEGEDVIFYYCMHRT